MAEPKETKAGTTSAQQRAAIVAKQKAAARRNTMIALVAAGAIAALFIAAIVFIVNKPKGADAGGPFEVYSSDEPGTPSAADALGGIFVGMDGLAGGTAPGEDAVRVDVYEDPICRACGALSYYAGAEISTLREEGLIELYYHPLSYFDRNSEGTNYSTRASSALASVSEHDPAAFEDFFHLLFISQPAQGVEGLTNLEIADLARTAGVSEEAIAAIADGEFTQWVATATDEASRAGVTSTPTVVLDGVILPPGVWAEQGTLTSMVLYIQQYGADAFAEALAQAQSVTPSPQASA